MPELESPGIFMSYIILLIRKLIEKHLDFYIELTLL